MKKKKIKKRTLQSYKDEAWELQSLYIRKRDRGICYTCNARNWDEERGENSIKGMQAGHFKHGVLDYDDMNIHCQCIKCNHFNSGKLDVYAERLIRDYGLDLFNDLCNRAMNALKGERLSIEDYEKIIANLRVKLSTVAF